LVMLLRQPKRYHRLRGKLSL